MSDVVDLNKYREAKAALKKKISGDPRIGISEEARKRLDAYVNTRSLQDLSQEEMEILTLQFYAYSGLNGETDEEEFSKFCEWAEEVTTGYALLCLLLDRKIAARWSEEQNDIVFWAPQPTENK